MAEERYTNTDDVITVCPICLSDVIKPKLLSCGHTFCLSCLESHWKDKSPGNTVACPVCRQQLNIPESGLGALDDNAFMQNLIEIKQHQIQSKKIVVCESCMEDNDGNSENVVVATSYCFDCSQNLCESCSKPHRRWKGGPHVVKQLEDESAEGKSEVKCHAHSEESVEYYCVNCKVNICSICSSNEQHKSHEMDDIDKIAAKFISEIEGNTHKLSMRIHELRRRNSELDAERYKVKEAVKQAEADIQKHGNELKRLIDHRVSEQLKELASLSEQTLKEVSSRQESLSASILSAESCRRLSQRLTSSGVSSSITREASELRVRTNEILTSDVTDVYQAPDIIVTTKNIHDVVASSVKVGVKDATVNSTKEDTIDSTPNMLSPRLTKSVKSERPVQEIAYLPGKLFVLRTNNNGVINVYSDNCVALTDIVIKVTDFVGDLRYMAVCADNRSLYVVYPCRDNDTIMCVSENGTRRVLCSRSSVISLYAASRRLMVLYSSNNAYYAGIYGPENKKIHEVDLTQRPNHAIMTSGYTFIVCFSAQNSSSRAHIDELDYNGKEIRTFDRQQLLKTPTRCCLDEVTGKLYVADGGNHQVLVLDAQLQLENIVRPENMDPEAVPHFVCYIGSKKTLVIDQFYSFSVYQMT